MPGPSLLPRSRRPRSALTITLGLITALAAGCGAPTKHSAPLSPSSRPSAHSSTAAMPSSPTPTSSAAPSASPSATLPAATPPLTVVPTATSGGGNPGAPASPTCRTSQLQLTVERADSASQQAFATLTLRNLGRACTTAGYPGVSLLRAGTEIGQPATRTASRYHTIVLQPNASAQAAFVISTSCNAPRSDHVRVFPPDQTQALIAPLSVFACTSHIEPLHTATP